MATVKKAQKGVKTPMQKYKAEYPKADTSAAGDTRFGDEINAYAPKKVLDRIAAGDKAFDAKYGKGKPAVDKVKAKPTKIKVKGKTGIKVKKAQNGDVEALKKRADISGNRVISGDLRDAAKNISDFAKRQKKLKESQNKGKPGYDEKGKSKFSKMFGLKKGGKVAKSGMKMSKMSKKKAC